MGKGSRGGSGHHGSSSHGSSHSSSHSSSSYSSGFGSSNNYFYSSGGNWGPSYGRAYSSSPGNNCSCFQCCSCLAFLILIIFTVTTINSFSSTEETIVMDPGESRQLKLSTWSYGSGYISDSSYSVAVYKDYDAFQLTDSDTISVDKTLSVSYGSYEYLVYYLNYGSSFDLSAICNEGIWLFIFNSESDFESWVDNIDYDKYAAKKWIKSSNAVLTRFSQQTRDGSEVYIVFSNEASSTTVTANIDVDLSVARTLYSTEGLVASSHEFSLNADSGNHLYILLLASSDTSSDSYQVVVHLEGNKTSLAQQLMVIYGTTIGVYLCFVGVNKCCSSRKEASPYSNLPTSINDPPTSSSSSSSDSVVVGHRPLLNASPVSDKPVVYASAVIADDDGFPLASAPQLKA